MIRTVGMVQQLCVRIIGRERNGKTIASSGMERKGDYRLPPPQGIPETEKGVRDIGEEQSEQYIRDALARIEYTPEEVTRYHALKSEA